MIKLFDEIPRLENEYILLRKLKDGDADALREMTQSTSVYQYLPTFLYEQKYEDLHMVIRRLYEDCLKEKESLILGVFIKEGMQFCGLAEFYGFKDSLHKTCIGYRFSEQYWGKGIASQVVGLMVDYLYSRTDIEIITASTMIENHASARVLEKNGFLITASAVPEDWGYSEPTIVDKWFL